MSAEHFQETVPWCITDFNHEERLLAYHEWHKVRVGIDENPLLSASLLAEVRPTGICLSSFFEGQSFRLFLDIAFHLQRVHGDSDIYLPVRSLAPILKVSPRAVSTYRRVAVLLGFMKETQPATRTRATRFRVDLNSFPNNGEEQ